MSNPNTENFPQVGFLKSNCYFSDDSGAINDALFRNFNVLCLVEPEESAAYKNCAISSTLLPHPNIISLYLDMEYNSINKGIALQRYMTSYQNYLASPELEGSIVNIIASIYKTNKNLLLFCPIDSNREFHILENICIFLNQTFGIISGNYESLYNKNNTINPGFVDNPTTRFRILDLLYTNGFINIDEYAIKIPPNVIPSPRAMSLILQFVNQPMVDMKTSMIVAINILDSIRKEVQTGKISPIIDSKHQENMMREKELNKIIKHSEEYFQNNQQPQQSTYVSPSMNYGRPPIPPPPPPQQQDSNKTHYPLNPNYINISESQNNPVQQRIIVQPPPPPQQQQNLIMNYPQQNPNYINNSLQDQVVNYYRNNRQN